MFNKAAITTLSMLLLTVACLAQSAPRIIFSRFTKKEGLASNTVFQTVQDRHGYLWVATQNGLQRFDGNRFVTFRHAAGDTTTIPDNNIGHLFIDSKERLWVMFDKSIGLFDTKKFRFTPLALPQPVNMVKKIVEDPQHQLIVFADNKQFTFDEHKKIFISGYALPALPEGYTFNDMTVDQQSGQYWLTGKQGSLLYDPKQQTFSTKEKNIARMPVIDSLGPVTSARYPFIAQDGSWWVVNWIPFIGPAPVLYKYDPKANRVQQFEKIRAYKAESYYEIWGLFQQQNKQLWAYGMGLLSYYDPSSQRFIHINSNPFEKNGIEFDMISNMYEDREKNVWVSTNNGLYRFNSAAQVFRNHNNRRPEDTTNHLNAVSAIVQTNNNEIWVGTWGAGLFSYSKDLQPITNPLDATSPAKKSIHILSLSQHRNGDVWMGTHTGEINIANPVTKQVNAFTYPPLRGEMIQQIFEDKQGNTWIASTTGMLVKCINSNWRDTTGSFNIVMKDIGDIFKLYQDKNNNLWVCTATSGVYKLDVNTGKTLQEFKETTASKEGLLNDGATDIVQYNDSLMLMASDGLCIYNTKTDRLRYLTAADGLPAEHITCIIVDQKNRLWVACDGGLYRLNIDNKLFVSYDEADGITGDVFQVSAANLLKDGRIGLGTVHDFIVFDPETAIFNAAVPAVNITGITLGSQYLLTDSIQQKGQLSLSYNNTFVKIDLSTLSYKDRYYTYYMLEGLDDTWKMVTNNEIIYQYIPPGNYTLKLKSESGDGKWSEAITSLNINVHAPFWRTWWFYGLLILLTGGLLFWLDHKRIKRKAAIFEMRSNIADGLYQDINQALSNISILSEMAKIKAGKEPEKSAGFIDQIHDKSQQMTLAMDDILWSIDPSNDNMQNFISRLQEHINLLRHERNAEIALVAEKKSANLPISMRIRNDVYSLFKAAVSDVVNAGGNHCHIHIRFSKPDLIYKLKFDTAYVDMGELNALRNRKDLADKVKKLKAKVEFTKNENTATFILSIPLNGDDAFTA